MPHRSILTLFLLTLAAPAFAQSAATPEMLAQGKALVTEKCGSCHAVGVDGESTHPEAPPFRTLGQRYPVSQLAESLAEGIVSGHPDMPVFEFEVDDVDRIIAWLEHIQK